MLWVKSCAEEIAEVRGHQRNSPECDPTFSGLHYPQLRTGGEVLLCPLVQSSIENSLMSDYSLSQALDTLVLGLPPLGKHGDIWVSSDRCSFLVGPWHTLPRPMTFWPGSNVKTISRPEKCIRSFCPALLFLELDLTCLCKGGLQPNAHLLQLPGHHDEFASIRASKNPTT